MGGRRTRGGRNRRSGRRGEATNPRRDDRGGAGKRGGGRGGRGDGERQGGRRGGGGGGGRRGGGGLNTYCPCLVPVFFCTKPLTEEKITKLDSLPSHGCFMDPPLSVNFVLIKTHDLMRTLGAYICVKDDGNCEGRVACQHQVGAAFTEGTPVDVYCVHQLRKRGGDQQQQPQQAAGSGDSEKKDNASSVGGGGILTVKPVVTNCVLTGSQTIPIQVLREEVLPHRNAQPKWGIPMKAYMADELSCEGDMMYFVTPSAGLPPKSPVPAVPPNSAAAAVQS